MSVEARSIRAIRITLLANGASALGQIAIMAVLARLVTSEEYGLVAGALVLIRPVQYLLTSGAERAVILMPGLTDDGVDSAFWAILAAALGVSILLAAAVPPAVHFGVPADFGAILLALTPLVALSAAGTVFRGMLRRRFAFGGLATADLAGQMLGTGAVAILAAAAGWGAYALVAGVLAQALLQTGVAAARAYAAGLRIRPRLRRAALAPVLAASLSISRTSALEVLYGQLPSAIIGGMLGAHALGLYNRAYSLAQVPVEMIVTPLTRVQTSSVSALRDELAPLRRACGNLIETSAAAILPLCGGIMLAGPELVAVALGPDWAEAADTIPWLALAAAAIMLGHVFAVVNEGALRLDERFRIQATTMLVAAAGLALGAWGGGLAGALAGWTAGAVVFMALHLDLMARSVLHLPTSAVLARLLPGATAAAACCAAVTALPHALPAGIAPAWLLGADVAACGACVVLVYAVLFPRVMHAILQYGGLRRVAAAEP